MQSKKSSNVSWNIVIDDQKCQHFCLSYSQCPGWKIKPIGFEKVATYSMVNIIIRMIQVTVVGIR